MITPRDTASWLSRWPQLVEMTRHVTHFTEALRLQPDNADIHLSFGNLLMDLHRTVDALAQYEQAVSLMPQSLEAQSRLAEAYMREGRFSDALGRLNAAVTIARDSGQADAVRTLADSIKTCQARLGRKGP